MPDLRGIVFGLGFGFWIWDFGFRIEGIGYSGFEALGLNVSSATWQGRAWGSK